MPESEMEREKLIQRIIDLLLLMPAEVMESLLEEWESELTDPNCICGTNTQAASHSNEQKK